MSFQSSLFITLLFTYPVITSGDNGVITKFFEDYNKAVRPGFEKGIPTTIQANIYVESFGNIEEANMEFKVYSYFGQQWTDSRLAGRLNRTLNIKGEDIDNIWVPDPYCYNARESNMMVPNGEINSYVKIKPNGEIISNRRVTLLASCVMNLEQFPLDSQTCHLKFGSYAYYSKDIVYKWVPGEVVIGSTEMAQFEYKGAKLTSDVEVFASGNFSTITVTFSFQRRIGYFLIQVYFPDIFVVILSWIVFFMDKDDIGNRMALGITTVLTIMFLLGSLNGNLPKVSYPKALDWYLLISFLFVFLSLIECIIVYLFMTKATTDEQKSTCKNNDISLPRKISLSLKSTIRFKTGDFSVTTHGNLKNGNVDKEGSNDDLGIVHMATETDTTLLNDGSLEDSDKNRKMVKIANVIDNTSRFLFPFAFLCYNVFYWTYY